MLNARSGLVVVGCVFAGFVTSAGPALVARAAEPPRWVEGALGASTGTLASDAGEAQRRIAQLEQRLKELEAERGRANPSSSNGSASRELDAVIAQNRELTARNRALTGENQALAQNHLFESPRPAAACTAPPDAPDPRTQIRYWAQRMRAGDFRARLTPEQNAAVQVLLRRERELDPHNPWSQPGAQALAASAK